MAKFVSALVSTISSEKELIILQQLNTSLARHQQSDEGSFLPFLDGDEDFPGMRQFRQQVKDLFRRHEIVRIYTVHIKVKADF